MEWHIPTLILIVGCLAFVAGCAVGLSHAQVRPDADWERTAREEAQPWCGRRRD